MPIPNVMTAREFKKRTTPKNIFKRHRGTLLTAIDTAMEGWADGACPPDQKIPMLLLVVQACRAWVDAKGHKTSENSEMRRGVIKELAGQAFERMQYEIFESRKQNQPNVETRGLQGAYGHERTLYEQSGKTVAPSGTTVHFHVSHSHEYGLDFGGKGFDQLTPQEFKALTDAIHARYDRPHGYMGEPSEVCFLKKSDRIKKLVVIENGYLYDGPQERLDHGDDQAAFVIDEYGNLYCGLQHIMERGMPSYQRFNHSTFNAGKNVICAGMIQVSQGRLKYIDNMSGHYKPTRTHLLNALQLLRDCGVDLYANVKAGIAEPLNGPRGGKMVMKYYNNAAALLSHPNRPPDKTVDMD